ncbi:A disintegrin and metalloproteinase with thrombospondin motifs 6-like isoform X2 [Oscarella lobularis]
MSCGRGVQKRRRRCKSLKCSGKSFQYRLCHIQACPPGSDTSRQVTCASYNSHWKPYLHLDPRLQCQVWCVRAREPVKLADRAPDGLACGNDDQHVCVQGKCVRIRCEIDDCGVCGGNGSSCASVSGRFLRRYTRVRFIHRLVVRVPAGASRIRVEEENSSNYLALKSGLHSNFFFNGQAIANSGIYSADGASVIYQRNHDHSETIFIKGPTLRPLHIMVLVQENAVNVSYRYQLDRRSDSISLRHDYVWTYTEWSACPRSCGGGRQTRQLVCKETATGFPVASSLCGGGETPTASRDCNVQPCEPRWQSGEWTTCSASCGVGQRRRVVTCVEDRDARRGGPKKVSKRRCSSERKPKKKKKCEIQSCPTGTWVDNGWQPCSITCGEGKQWKSFVCQSTVTEKEVAMSECASVLLPSAVRGCSMPSCPPRECRDESEYYCRTVLATVGSWICDSSDMSYFSERDCCQSCLATR